MPKFVALVCRSCTIERVKFEATDWLDAMLQVASVCTDPENELISLCSARPVRTGDGTVFVAASVYAAPSIVDPYARVPIPVPDAPEVPA